ncbi:MAG: hypothetical protein M3458_03065 [Acidobacteriota bacterium]|nr:hypothetical protein [Acidobacteriota bacterium]
MPTNARELYTSAVRQLPAKERLQLAALILEDLTRTPETLDIDDAWSDQDEQDLTAFALAHATTQYEKDGDLV